MAKFCGRCGSPLNENGKCPNCDTAHVIQPEKTQAADAQFAQPVPENAWQPQQTPAPAPKKKSKLSVFIIIAAAVVLGILVFCAFFFHWFGLGKSGGSNGVVTSQRKAIITTSYGTFHSTKGLNLANKDGWDYQNNREEARKMVLGFTDESGDIREANLTMMAQDGDDFYGTEPDNYNSLYHCRAIDDQNGEKEVWFSEEQLKNSCIKLGESSFRLNYFIADGDYVYANIYPYPEFIASQKDMNERIVKLGKDGKTVEFVGDGSIRALEFVVRDGWIYYVDNGFVYDGEIRYDANNIGLYKVKTDGSEKTLLWKDFSGKAEDAMGNAQNLSLCGDHLYFLDISKGADSSPLCRIKLDGSGFETLSSHSVYTYTIDPGSNTVYYITGCYTTAYASKAESVVKLDLDSKKEETICNGKLDISNDPNIAYCDGCLYLYFQRHLINLDSKLKETSGGNAYADLGKITLADSKTYLLLREYYEKFEDNQNNIIKNEVNWKECEEFR